MSNQNQSSSDNAERRDSQGINPEDIGHLAKLSRISLTESDEKILQNDLPKIVDFVNDLSLAGKIELPESQGTELGNLRADLIQSRNISIERLSDLAPGWQGSKGGGFVEVPAVFDRGE